MKQSLSSLSAIPSTAGNSIKSSEYSEAKSYVLIANKIETNVTVNAREYTLTKRKTDLSTPTTRKHAKTKSLNALLRQLA